MSTSDVIGRWKCKLVTQEQSESSAAAAGPYPDEPTESDADETDFAGATLELLEDGRYELKAQDAHNSSRGTWALDGKKLAVTQDTDCVNGHEGIAFVKLARSRILFGYKLVADAHDGLDTLVLAFARDKPSKRAKSAGFVEQLLAATNEGKVYATAGKELAGADAVANARLLWDAWVEGRFPGRRNGGFEAREALLGDERVAAAGAFTLDHARFALSKEPSELGQVQHAVERAVRQLPEDPSEKELTAVLSPGWITSLAYSRILGGGLPETFYARPLVPRPAIDDATRAHLRTAVFSRLDALPDLYPAGASELADVVWRYRGHKLLTAPLALIEQRGIERDVITSTTSWLEQSENLKAFPTVHASVLQSAVLFNVVLSARQGIAIGPAAIAGLGVECKYTQGGIDDAEKALLRAMALPSDVAALVKQRFYL